MRCPSLLTTPNDRSQSRSTCALRPRYFGGSLNRRKLLGWSCGTRVSKTTSSKTSGEPLCTAMIRNSSRKATSAHRLIGPLPPILKCSNTWEGDMSEVYPQPQHPYQVSGFPVPQNYPKPVRSTRQRFTPKENMHHDPGAGHHQLSDACPLDPGWVSPHDDIRMRYMMRGTIQKIQEAKANGPTHD